VNNRDLARPAAALLVVYVVTPLLFVTGTLGALVLASAGADGARNAYHHRKART
jgi:hypothetical protein